MTFIQNIIGEVSIQSFFLFIFIIIISIIIGNLLKFIIIRLLKGKTSPVFYKTLSRIIMYSLYFVVFYFGFKVILHLNIASLLAALGVLGIALFLPMLPILQNVFAGVVLSFERPFKENDIIEFDGIICIVKDLMLRKTILRSLDGRVIIASNIKFMTDKVINYSKGEFIRVDLNVDIKNSPDLDLDKASNVIYGILHEDPNILPNVPKKELSTIEKFFVMPKNLKVLEPEVLIKKVSKDKISLIIWFWTWDILRKEKIVSDVNRTLIKEFKMNKLHFG